ncbi:G-protein coupled receptor family C group 5 member C-like [Lampris incognitus]|uniref:G-protein coupled receptor family C group 5 member C-like n=1 Tax=Lampris incognitus TaxID=2546036 RepID=UPI0024B5CF39|nr:G-protein coupled receptor family C group 5 member C-like [Lampris incognitus]
MTTISPPKGCSASLNFIYYNLCDLAAVWGIVVEAIAAAGVVCSFVLLVVLMGSLPFVTDKKRKSMVALQASFLVFTLGLFGLSFAFVVRWYFTTCVLRRFLFGVLFAGCLACLAMHGLWLALLERHGQGPRGWILCLGALTLWLVEVIINTEWLIITVARSPQRSISELSCKIANQDFVMALIYVMALLLAVVLTAVPLLAHKQKQWRQDRAFILATGVFTMAIWVVWIFMFIHGNQVAGNTSWDEPTLAIALVSNAWVFLILYTIPEICLLTKVDPDQEQPHDGDPIYPASSLIYENIPKQRNLLRPNVYVENKAFSMDEPNAVTKNPLSPYGSYNGQLRSSVYQPTELAFITKGLPNSQPHGHGLVLPRAKAHHPNQGSGGPLPPAAHPLPSPRTHAQIVKMV